MQQIDVTAAAVVRGITAHHGASRRITAQDRA